MSATYSMVQREEDAADEVEDRPMQNRELREARSLCKMNIVLYCGITFLGAIFCIMGAASVFWSIEQEVRIMVSEPEQIWTLPTLPIWISHVQWRLYMAHGTSCVRWIGSETEGFYPNATDSDCQCDDDVDMKTDRDDYLPFTLSRQSWVLSLGNCTTIYDAIAQPWLRSWMLAVLVTSFVVFWILGFWIVARCTIRKCRNCITCTRRPRPRKRPRDLQEPVIEIYGSL